LCEAGRQNILDNDNILIIYIIRETRYFAKKKNDPTPLFGIRKMFRKTPDPRAKKYAHTRTTIIIL